LASCRCVKSILPVSRRKEMPVFDTPCMYRSATLALTFFCFLDLLFVFADV
jgi:hypothetical protein